MSEKKRIPTTDEPFAWNSPFASLKNVELPPAPKVRVNADRSGAVPKEPKEDRGRVDIKRQTAHRGGKTVTVISGFLGMSLAEKERLATEIQKALWRWRYCKGRTNRDSG